MPGTLSILAYLIVLVITGAISAFFLTIYLRSVLKPVYRKKLVFYWLLLSISYFIVFILLLWLEDIFISPGSHYDKTANIVYLIINVLYALLIGYLAAKKIKKYIELSKPSVSL